MSEDMEEHKVPTNAEIVEFTKAVEQQYFFLELQKLQVLPDNYWPEEWRKSVHHISTLALALLHFFSQEKGDMHTNQIARALSQLVAAMVDLESEAFNPDFTKRR